MKSGSSNGSKKQIDDGGVFPKSFSEKYVMRRAKFKRTLYDGAFASSIPAGAGYARNFQLDELSGFTDFTTLWDQYRLARIDYKLIPRINVHSFTTAAVSTTAIMPTIAIWSDPDDSTAPAAQGESLEVENAQYCSGVEVITGSFIPRTATAVYGGAFTSYGDFTGWCDCTSDDIEWYGLKCWVTPDGVTQSTHQVWDAYFAIHVEFRKTR